MNTRIFFQTILEYKIYNNLKASFGNYYLEFTAKNNLYNEYLENQKISFFQTSNSSSKFILSLWVSNIVKNSIHNFNNIPFDTQLINMYSKLYDVYKKNIEKLCFLTSDYVLGFFYKIDKLTYEEMTILLEMNIDKCSDIFKKYNIDIIFNWNNIEENNNTDILVYQKPNKENIDSLIYLFHCDLFNVTYIELVQIHLANFLQYMIDNNNINIKLKPIQVVAFNQLINVVPTFIGLGFYIKIILNNSSNQYNDNLPYDIQKKSLCLLILKTYNNDSEKIFKLTIDFMLTLFSIEKKLSEEEISYFLNTDLINVSKVYEKYDITTIIKKWN
jgi:hypothetical protein